jgi:hypothetical protein
MQKQRISLKKATAPPTKSVIAPKQRISLSTVNAEIAEPIEKFQISATERTFLVKFGHQQFGVVKHDTVNRFENLQRNCEPKDNKIIAEVIGIMKTYLKAGIGFTALKERMSKNDALFAPTIKVFINRINKA